MKLNFQTELAGTYTSLSQKIRVLSESWVNQSIYCPNCGHVEISDYPNNKPVADFYCSACKEDFELKSKKNKVGSKIVDGAYSTMIKRLESANNPNFFILNYDLKNLFVTNFFVIPKHFFIPELIEKRKPLAASARRSGWVGCNILLKDIPETGKIYYVEKGSIIPKNQVLDKWQKTLFLRDESEINTKGWLLDVMLCIEQLNKSSFVLDEIYAFEATLARKHPNNKHIKDKIRQQLQVLRDKGFLKFATRGQYQLLQ